MSLSELLETADEVGRMIEEARESLAGGGEVDLTKIEDRVADLYGRVASDPVTVTRHGAVPLTQTLDTLLVELDALERDLTTRHGRDG